MLVGVFGVRVVGCNLQDATKATEVELVVDTGAAYPLIPRRLAESLGIRSVETRTFTLADGSRTERELGWGGLMEGARAGPSLVIRGGEDDAPIWGAFALGGLGLEAAPVANAPKIGT